MTEGPGIRGPQVELRAAEDRVELRGLEPLTPTLPVRFVHIRGRAWTSKGLLHKGFLDAMNIGE